MNRNPMNSARLANTASITGADVTLFTWAVFALVSLFALSPHLPASSQREPAPRVSSTVLSSAPLCKVCLTISGMSCSACTRHIEGALSGVPGVSRASVDYDAAEACVFARSDIRIESLIEAVEQSGYEAALRRSSS